eukprot:GHRR01024396.1.p1 GENE.GHRR01024396.1~~GHRR01024396.1.p1  ORF type:complete len:245 (+),score=74.44 GHRR01024396.1:38-736(+)
MSAARPLAFGPASCFGSVCSLMHGASSSTAGSLSLAFCCREGRHPCACSLLGAAQPPNTQHAHSLVLRSVSAGKVLVHCAYGQSRSAAVVIGYLMWRDSKPYHQCLQHVQACRPLAGPNAGFEMQLCFFKELGFDFNRWPGWNAATFLAIRQQQLVLLQQQKQVVDEREDLQDYKHNLLAAKHGLQLHKQHKRSEGSECSQQQSEQQDLDSRADTERSLPRTLPQPICCTIM